MGRLLFGDGSFFWRRKTMNRREWLKGSTQGISALTLPALLANRLSSMENGQAAPAIAEKKLSTLKITDIRTILTAPAGIRLVVVKVLTNEPGLFGLGCATFTQRARAVETAVNHFLKPFLVGKDPMQIEDIW